MYEKLILMIVAFMCFYLFIIVCSRVSFKLS